MSTELTDFALLDAAATATCDSPRQIHCHDSDALAMMRAAIALDRRCRNAPLPEPPPAAPGGPAGALGADEQATVKDSLTAEQNQRGAQGKGET